VDRVRIEKLGVEVVERPLASSDTDFAKHDPGKLADTLLELYRERAHTKVF